ncbi:MAG: AI-2E family transporter [Woeseiaceae bacterium]|jgi:predicted PurR-regulated permease PerM|nr:AI-2E family transporter [Woeseiaceae bacterium]
MIESNLRTNWLIAIALVGWVLYLLAPILTPFVAAALFAYLGDPLADRLERLGLPRSLAVVTVFILTFLVVVLLVVLVGPLVKKQVVSLLQALPGLASQAEQVWLPRVSELLGIEFDSDVGLGAFLAQYSEMAGQWSGKILTSVSRGGGAVATAVISLFLIPILTFYMLRDWDGIMLTLGSLIPASQQETVFKLLREADEMLGAFLRGQLLVMVGLAILYSVGLTLSGVEYAVAIGVVSGVVSFVPYLGLVFGIALASLTVVLEPSPLWPLAGVVATFTIAQVIEGTVLTPKLVGDRIGLHPVIVIFAVAAGGQLFGFFGILLALPAAAVLSVLARFAYDRYLREHPEVVEQLEGDPVAGRKHG